MADIKQTHVVAGGGAQGSPPIPRGGAQGSPPIPQVEGDGVSYSGIVWFVVILVVTTVVCQVLMVVMFNAMAYQRRTSDAASPPAPLAHVVAPSERPAPEGRVYPEMVAISPQNGPAPSLLVREPVNLETFRAHEHDVLTTYGWVDKNAGTYRIPIDRAKDLLMERGLPVRGSASAAKDAKVVKEVKK